MRGSRGFVRLAFLAQILVGAAAGFWLAASTPPDVPGLVVSLTAMACGVIGLGAMRKVDPRSGFGRLAMRLNAMMVAIIVLAAGLTFGADHQLHVTSRRLELHLLAASLIALPFAVGWVGLWREGRGRPASERERPVASTRSASQTPP